MTFSPPRNSSVTGREEPDAHAPRWGWPLTFAERACCCAAKPVLLAVMPPTPVRTHSVDLLLCDHHFLASRATLTAVGANVYDECGSLIKMVVRTPPVVGVAHRVGPSRHRRIPPAA